MRGSVFRHFKFDAKLAKPNLEKDPDTDQWVVPTSGSIHFTYQPPLSSASMRLSADKKMESDSDSCSAPPLSTAAAPRGAKEQRETSFLGEPRKTFRAGGHITFVDTRGSIAPAMGIAKVRQSFQLSGLPEKKSILTTASFRSDGALVDWAEVDELYSNTQLRVSAVRYSTIRSMFLSFVTRAEQLRFIHACSKDMSFNYVQVVQFCKDRPEITSQICSALFSSISSRSSQLMILGQLSSSVAPLIAKEVSKCLWLQEGNLSGKYCLDLLRPADYWVAENCLLVNAWETEVSRLSQNPDVSQRGNFEMLRNEMYNEEPFSYTREWCLPSHGRLHLDYSSIRRPPPTAAAMSEASEMARYLSRATCTSEAKLTALRAISANLHMSTYQFRNLVQCFPAGTARQDFFCMFHTRVVDAGRFLGPDLLYNAGVLCPKDRHEIFRRVGALHLLNPLHPEGVKFQSNLAVYEERMIVEYLVQLSTEEPGGKVLGCMGVDMEDDDIDFKPLPASWADKGVPCHIERLVCCYETTSVNMQWRMTLAEKYCIGHFEHP
jgi:hypothetical protein